MHIPFKTLKKQKTGSGQGLPAQKNRSVKTILLVGILVGLGAWLGGSGVLASAGKGSSTWERLVRTFTPGQSGDQAGKTARPGDRAGRDTKHPDITKDLPSANDTKMILIG